MPVSESPSTVPVPPWVASSPRTRIPLTPPGRLASPQASGVWALTEGMPLVAR